MNEKESVSERSEIENQRRDDVSGTEEVLKIKGQGTFGGLTPVIFQMNVIPLQQLPGILLGIGEEEKAEDLSLLKAVRK